MAPDDHEVVLSFARLREDALEGRPGRAHEELAGDSEGVERPHPAVEMGPDPVGRFLPRLDHVQKRDARPQPSGEPAAEPDGHASGLSDRRAHEDVTERPRRTAEEQDRVRDFSSRTASAGEP